MTYTEMQELGKKQLSDLFIIGEYDKETQRRMIVAFVEGFLRGEIEQINKRLQDA